MNGEIINCWRDQIAELRELNRKRRRQGKPPYHSLDQPERERAARSRRKQDKSLASAWKASLTGPTTHVIRGGPKCR